jgi:hypothetical protein
MGVAGGVLNCWRRFVKYFGGKAFGPQRAQRSAVDKYGGTNHAIEPAMI